MTARSLARLRRRLTHRGGGDRGSIVLAMLVTLVATSVAALIVPVLVSATTSTAFDDRRTQQLAAAQSGVETALGRIRAAADSTGRGVIAALPCATLTGTVLGNSSLRYQVTISYYGTDPANLSPSDLANKAIQCVPGLGTPLAPSFAKLVSLGTDRAGTWGSVPTRRVEATYVVKGTNANLVGGLFRVNKLPNTQDLCLDAGTSPKAGTTVTMQSCDSSKASQKWAYNKTLTVSLVSTRVTDAGGNPISDGLCIDGTSNEQANVTQLVLAACGTVTTLKQQQWSMNDNAGMEGTSDGQTLNGLCWTVRTPDTVGSTVWLTTGCRGTNGYDNIHSWQPEAAVGAGASGADYGELVNYKQFGRCLDVTNTNVNSTYLIAWPCKQQPDPTRVLWNQRWTLPTLTNGTGTGRITTTTNGTTYCLQSPESDRAGAYVTVTPCPVSSTEKTTWTVRTKVGTYARSYQIEDWSGGGTSPGLCLQPTDPTQNPPDYATEGTQISKIVVRACTRDTLQKWNAPPNPGDSSVKDQKES